MRAIHGWKTRQQENGHSNDAVIIVLAAKADGQLFHKVQISRKFFNVSSRRQIYTVIKFSI